MFVHPVGLLALLAVPAVVALHLFRRRFRPRVVSATFLWRTREHVPMSGRRRTPLRRTPSFWLELLTALLLGLALGGPRACNAGEARHLVAVLDDSASMSAVGPDGQSFAAAAVAELRERIGDLPGSSRVSLVLSGRKPRLLAGPAAFPGEAAAALAAYAPRALRHDLAPAAALAAQLAGEAEVLVLTDHYEPDRFPAQVELVTFGRPLDNVAITHATRARVRSTSAHSEARERVYLTVANLGRAAARRALRLQTLDGLELGREELELAPDERRHLVLDLPPGAPSVAAQLSGDGLALDDRAVLAPLPHRELALASTLGIGLAEHLGLADKGGGAAQLSRLVAFVPDSHEIGTQGLAQLVLTTELPFTLGPLGSSGSLETRAPAAAPEASLDLGRPRGTEPWYLVLGTDTSASAVRRDLVGPFLLDRSHPLVDGVTLDGVLWSTSARESDLGERALPVVSAGNTPLVTEQLRGGERVFRLDLDPWRSSLHDSQDWPILLANLAELRRDDLPGPRRTNLLVGESFVWRHAVPGDYVLSGPAGELALTHPAAHRDLSFDVPDLPGLYELRLVAAHTPGGAGDESDTAPAADQAAAPASAPLVRIGVSFADPFESDLQGARARTRPAAADAATVLAGFTWLEMLLLFGAGACLALDWWVLARAARGPRVLT